jgi:NADPH-dependent 2,4-dienoyl-CoA reductase/sulfur reductase-like enzyme/rhodanese-related sulfurtransferase
MSSMKHIVIIGGVACGPKAAARARRCDPESRITIIEEGNLISYASCGIPYYVSGLVQKRNSLLVRSAKDFKSIADIDVMIDTRVESIDRANHRLNLLNRVTNAPSDLEYDKLVLATGANPVRPPLEGLNLAGIFSVKDVNDADQILAFMNALPVKKAVVVGGGLIGMEMLEVLSTRGIAVTVVEALSHILPGALDEEIAAPVETYLRKKGIALNLSERVARFEGQDGRIQRVLTDKSSLDADLAILAIGVRPNVKLARDAGLAISKAGAIVVNEYLETSDPDIYAGGDCVENKNLVTGLPMFAPMGSTANKHGRVIGTNATGGYIKFPGVIGTTIVKVLDYTLARTGLGEADARKAGYDVVTSLAPETDRPGYYPGSRDIILKLIVDKKSSRILGGQGMGRGEVAKRIDVLATAITYKADVDSIADLDLAYAPPYNTAQDPVHHAANIIRNKIDGLAVGLTPAQVKAKIDANEDFILLDVRTPKEWETWRIEAPQIRHIPQNMLFEKVNELPKDKEIVVTCRSGGRSYQSTRILKRFGFKNVKYAEGNLLAWPYEAFGGEKEPASTTPAPAAPATPEPNKH